MAVSELGGAGLFAASLPPAMPSLLLLDSSLAGIGLVAVGEGGAGLPGMGVLGICHLPFHPPLLRKLENSLSGIGLHETGLSGIGLDGS